MWAHGTWASVYSAHLGLRVGSEVIGGLGRLVRYDLGHRSLGLRPRHCFGRCRRQWVGTVLYLRPRIWLSWLNDSSWYARSGVDIPSGTDVGDVESGRDGTGYGISDNGAFGAGAGEASDVRNASAADQTLSSRLMLRTWGHHGCLAPGLDSSGRHSTPSCSMRER